MQTSTKIKLAKTGGLLLIRYPLARSVTRRVGTFVVKRKLRGVQASASDLVPAVPAPPSRRNAVLIIAFGAGGTAVALGALTRKRKQGAGDATAPIPATSPVVPPSGDSMHGVPATPTDTPASSDSPVGAPPVPAAPVATEVGDGDDALAARVQSALFGAETPLAVSVKAHSGVVTLEGAVSDLDAATQLVKDAEGVDGVRAVQSELEIQGAS